MNFKPLGDRIAVVPEEQKEKTAGGIIIPDTVKEKPIQGKVVAVGEGNIDENGKLIPMQVKIDDTIIYGKWAGTEVTVEGQDLVIMKESDVFGIINK